MSMSGERRVAVDAARSAAGPTFGLGERMPGRMPGRAACGLKPGFKLVFVLAFVLVLTACSTIKLGYENLPRLLAWQVNGYLSLDGDQGQVLKRHAEGLQRWHRQDQLPVYADFLRRTEEQLAGNVTSAQVSEWRQAVRTAWPPLADRLAPAVAEIGVSLRPEQLSGLRQALAKANDKAARNLVPADPKERLAARMRRLTERAEGFLGDLNEPQRALIERSAQSMATSEDDWWQQRLARQQAVLALLTSLSQDRPEPAAATRDARAVLGAFFDEPASGVPPQVAAARSAGDQLTVDLLALATPEQKRRAIRRLSGYRDDFDLLASR